MKDVRLKFTNDEKLVQNLGLDNSVNFNMSEGDIQEVLKKEQIAKFNDEVDNYINEFEQHLILLKEVADQMGSNPEKLEIRPMTSRLLIQPFENNPFQRIQTKGNLIIDTGGFKADTAYNYQTGKNEQMKPDIVTGCVIEIGPEVKYIRLGDVVFYRDPTCVPVPFFKQHLVSVAENLIIAVVNEELDKRFKEING